MFSSHSCWHRTCDKRVLCQRLRTGCCAVSPHLLLNTGSGKKKKPSSHHPPALSDKYSHLALVYDIQHDVQVFLKAVLVLIPSRFTPEWYKKKIFNRIISGWIFCLHGGTLQTAGSGWSCRNSLQTHKPLLLNISWAERTWKLKQRCARCCCGLELEPVHLLDFTLQTQYLLN